MSFRKQQAPVSCARPPAIYLVMSLDKDAPCRTTAVALPLAGPLPASCRDASSSDSVQNIGSAALR
eukprot:3639276-Pyramimonas_sp.AAC.1